jgi:hypothetical protein
LLGTQISHCWVSRAVSRSSSNDTPGRYGCRFAWMSYYSDILFKWVRKKHTCFWDQR